jgi:signal peptidase II
MATRALLFVALLVASAGCDQATKRLAIERLDGVPPISLAGDTVRFELRANTGGFLSLGDGLPRGLQRLVFVGLVPLVLLLVCVLTLRSGALSAQAVAGLGLVAGGGLGNWLDRVGEAGAVTDFVSIGLGGLRTGVFNVADVAIVAGIVLLALARCGPEPERTPAPSA